MPRSRIAVPWPMLHPFERLGLALDYFRRSGGFTGFSTETARGWPRPEGGKYADLLYAVRGAAA